MAENKTIVIRKRSRKTPEVKRFIEARGYENWKREKAQRERDIQEIERELEEGNSYLAILRMLAEFIYDSRYGSGRSQSESWGEQWELQMEILRLTASGPDFFGGDDESGNSVVLAIHELVSVSANKGRIVGAKLKGRDGAKKKHEKHTKPDKEIVREWWLKWQSDQSLFKNKTAFDEAMFDKTGKKIRTIQEWRKALQSEHTVS